MKKRISVVLGCLACLGLLLALGGCQTAPSGGSAQGLVVPDGSTGDPPIIPHEVEASDGGEECIGCHAEGEMGAPKYPEWHATLVDCRQCHVTAAEQVEPFKTSY